MAIEPSKSDRSSETPIVVCEASDSAIDRQDGSPDAPPAARIETGDCREDSSDKNGKPHGKRGESHGKRGEQPPLPWTESGHWVFLILAAFTILASVILTVPGDDKVFLPGTNIALPGTCFSREMMGLPCPGCGMTRCFISLGHGQVERAWEFNPAGLMLFALVVAQVPWQFMQIRRIRRGRHPLRPWGIYALLWFLAAAMIGQWIIKMTYIHFFT